MGRTLIIEYEVRRVEMEWGERVPFFIPDKTMKTPPSKRFGSKFPKWAVDERMWVWVL